MSRSGYTDDYDNNWGTIRWRGAVAAALRGARGQAFLREMLAALDALPAPRLIAHELVKDGEVCAIGSVGLYRGLDMGDLDPDDAKAVAARFGIARAMAKEIEYENDESRRRSRHRCSRCARRYWDLKETPERRFTRMRAWVESHIAAYDAGRGEGG